MQYPSTERYSYWKSSWQPYLILFCGLVQLYCLFLNLDDWKTSLRLENIFSSQELWQSYVDERLLACLISGLAAVVFFGQFLVGAIARSQKMAHLLEGGLLLATALLWVGAGIFFGFPRMRAGWWLLLAALALTGSLHTFWKSRGPGQQTEETP